MPVLLCSHQHPEFAVRLAMPLIVTSVTVLNVIAEVDCIEFMGCQCVRGFDHPAQTCLWPTGAVRSSSTLCHLFTAEKD